MNEESIIKKYEEMFSDITLLEFKTLEDMFKEDFDKVRSPMVKRRWKRLIFNLKMADYKREKIWEFLNNDMPKGAFDYFVDAVHKGWFK